MNTSTRKLIKKTSFTEINEIRKIGNNVDAIVVKETYGKRLFGVIDKNGNTLIPASKYTEIYFLTNGFRAVDTAKNNYFISRTGQVLCTYKNGEKVVQYGKYFAVINERSLDLKGMYDYDGNQVDSIPESERTANNQYYVIRNTLLKDMLDKAEKTLSDSEAELVPASYREKYPDGKLQVVATNITPVQNCYVIDVREDFMVNKNSRYSVNKDFLFDLKGNLVMMTDYIKIFTGTKQYVAGITGEKNVQVFNTKDAVPTAIKCSLTGDYDYLEFSTFGNYIILSECKSYDEGAIPDPTQGIVFDTNGNIVKEFKDIYDNNNFIKVDGKYYNNKMEELSVDGELQTSTNGYMIMKDAGSGKTQVTFTDFNLNKITSAVFDDSIVNVPAYGDGDPVPLKADFEILPNGAGVHLSGVHFSYDYAKHYFIDKNGTIIKNFSDSKYYQFYRVAVNGADKQIVVLKTQKAASVNLGKTIITSFKNTAPGEMTVKWNTLKGITAYHVEVWRGDSCQYITKDAKTNSVVISDLTKGMTYYVKIRAYVNRGDGWKVGIYSKRVEVKISL